MPEDHSRVETEVVKEKLLRCEDREELERKILPMLRSQREAWTVKINDILKQFSKTEFASLCGVSRQAVIDWCKGSIPQSRDLFIRIGLAAGYDEQALNHLLDRYGRYTELYSKSREDCVCIYAIRHSAPEERLKIFDEIMTKMALRIFRPEDAVAEEVTTRRFDEKLGMVHSEDELERFIGENSAVFAGAYHKLYGYVQMFLQANGIGRVNEGEQSLNHIANEQEWSSSLKTSVYEIRKNCWKPTRNKIISLGLHLAMDLEQINQMLELAHMKELYANNPFEAAVIFILEDAKLNDKLDWESENFRLEDLSIYASEILHSLNLPDASAFLKELPEPEEEHGDDL